MIYYHSLKLKLLILSIIYSMHMLWCSSFALCLILCGWRWSGMSKVAQTCTTCLPMEGFQNMHQVETVHSYPATCITQLLWWHTVTWVEGMFLVYLLRRVVFLTLRQNQHIKTHTCCATWHWFEHIKVVVFLSAVKLTCQFGVVQ